VRRHISGMEPVSKLADEFGLQPSQMSTSKFHDWKHRYGKVNEHNGVVPRDWWLEDLEK
jgi:hypothetical protein